MNEQRSENSECKPTNNLNSETWNKKIFRHFEAHEHHPNSIYNTHFTEFQSYHGIKICSNIYTPESLLELISVYPKYHLI